MAIKTSFNVLAAVRLAVVVALLVMVAGCNNLEVAPFRITLCPIFGYDRRGYFRGNEDSSWVLRYDIRGGKTFEMLPEGCYSPTLGVLLLENVCGRDIKIKSPLSSSWMLHINGFVSRRSTPLIGCSWRNDNYVMLPKGATVALAVGMLEKNLAPYLCNCFVEYRDCDDVVVSNLMDIPFSPDIEWLTEEKVSRGNCTQDGRCQVADCRQDSNLETAVSLKLYNLFNLGSCNFAPHTCWPVILIRNDGEGLALGKDNLTGIVPGCWALVVTNNLKKETMSLRAFDSGMWKLIIKYKSGEKREISVLPIERDCLNDRITLKPGESLSVICGCKDSIYDIHKVDTISVCYINEGGGAMLISEELKAYPENKRVAEDYEAQ